MPLRQIGTRGRSVSLLAAVARHLHAAESPAYVNFEVAVLNELVAQLVEQRPFKAWVLGSSPSELTTHLRPSFIPGIFLCFLLHLRGIAREGVSPIPLAASRASVGADQRPLREHS